MDHVFKKIHNLAFILIFMMYGWLMGGTTGKLVGIVIDKSTGEPLPGVNILIENTFLGGATDVDGTFLILGIPPGIYSIRATMIGFSDIVLNQVVINVDKTTHLDFQMSETTLELGETIEVTAERPIVKRDLTSTESTVGREVIENLPVDDFNDIVNMQAGVVEGHFRGGRTGEVSYMINGIPVNDVYSGDIVLEVENNAIQELNVISGTFNAEYGQAMSGVVNIVTKEGGKQYTGNIKAYVGDYVSNNDDIFWNVENLNPIIDTQGDLSGYIPGFGGKLTFFSSARYFHNEGYIYGKDVFLPWDTSNFVPDNPEDRIVQSHRKIYQFSEELAQQLIEDADPYSMNKSDRYTGNLKLTYHLGSRDKISVEGMGQYRDWSDYAHEFRLDPRGNYTQNQTSINTGISWNHIFNPNTFMDIRYSYFNTHYKQYVYEDPFDPRYVTDDMLMLSGANAYHSSGQQMWNFDRTTTTNLAKLDLVSQITKAHQIKIGAEAKLHRLWMHEFYVLPEIPGRMAPLTTIGNNQYLRYPYEISAYLQDKIELVYMVINAGIRFDYFEPDGEIPEDFTRPTTSPTVPADPKYQISPRFGIAYPISEKGVIHVSYGHFFQIPNFQYLYTNPEFEVYPLQSIPSDPPHSTLNIIGNANLEPQETVIYELGLQQQVSTLFGLAVTAYYKDIRNLLGTAVHRTYQGDRYATYINRDYAFVRGITFEFEKRHSSGIGASVDYTYQIAKGNASDPNTAFLDAQSDPPKETEKQMVPLDWDRRHQINATLALGYPGNYMLSLIGRFGSGLPYTPTFQNVQVAVENSGRRPPGYYVDLYAYKGVSLFRMNFALYLKIYNLFDQLNETEVFRDTGRAGYTLEPLYVGGLRPRGLNTLEQYFIRPDYYSGPRRIQIGFEVGF